MEIFLFFQNFPFVVFFNTKDDFHQWLPVFLGPIWRFLLYFWAAWSIIVFSFFFFICKPSLCQLLSFQGNKSPLDSWAHSISSQGVLYLGFLVTLRDWTSILYHRKVSPAVPISVPRATSRSMAGSCRPSFSQGRRGLGAWHVTSRIFAVCKPLPWFPRHRPKAQAQERQLHLGTFDKCEFRSWIITQTLL